MSKVHPVSVIQHHAVQDLKVCPPWQEQGGSVAARNKIFAHREQIAILELFLHPHTKLTHLKGCVRSWRKKELGSEAPVPAITEAEVAKLSPQLAPMMPFPKPSTMNRNPERKEVKEDQQLYQQQMAGMIAGLVGEEFDAGMIGVSSRRLRK